MPDESTAVKSENKSIPHITKLLNAFIEVKQDAPPSGGKRKRTPLPPVYTPAFTPIQELIVNGLDEDQIWAQLELRTKSVCNFVQAMLSEDPMYDPLAQTEAYLLDSEEKLAGNSEKKTNGPRSVVNISKSEGEENNKFSEDDSEENDELEDGYRYNSEDEKDVGDRVDGELVSFKQAGVEPDEEEMVTRLHDSTFEDNGGTYTSQLQFSNRKKKRRKTTRSTGLEDDFFDLNSFDAEVESAEAGFTSGGGFADEDDDAGDDVDMFAPILISDVLRNGAAQLIRDFPFLNNSSQMCTTTKIFSRHR